MSLELRLREPVPAIHDDVIHATLSFLETAHARYNPNAGIVFVVGYTPRYQRSVEQLKRNRILEPCTIFDPKGQEYLSAIASVDLDGVILESGEGNLINSGVHFCYFLRRHIKTLKLERKETVGETIGFGYEVGTRHQAAKIWSYHNRGPLVFILSGEHGHIRGFQNGCSIVLHSENPHAQYEYDWDTKYWRPTPRRRSLTDLLPAIETILDSIRTPK